MKTTGIVRNMDRLGRIVLPMELRRVLGIEVKDPIEIFVEGETIILQKYRPACHFCNNASDLVSFGNRKVCKACIEKLHERAEALR